MLRKATATNLLTPLSPREFPRKSRAETREATDHLAILEALSMETKGISRKGKSGMDEGREAGHATGVSKEK